MQPVLFDQQVLIPSKVICVGRNYAKHIAELNNVDTGDMVIFMKPNSSISDDLASTHPRAVNTDALHTEAAHTKARHTEALHTEILKTETLHYEGEICFIVKNQQFVGVGFGLDLTKRQLQSQLKAKQLPWERAKSFDGAAVLSEFVALPELLDYRDLSLVLLIDGVLTQQGGVADMLFSPEVVLNDLKQFVTLEDGDVLMTGTPAGVGEVKKGAIFEGRILLGEEVLLSAQWTAM